MAANMATEKWKKNIDIIDLSATHSYHLKCLLQVQMKHTKIYACDHYKLIPNIFIFLTYIKFKMATNIAASEALELELIITDAPNSFSSVPIIYNIGSSDRYLV